MLKTVNSLVCVSTTSSKVDRQLHLPHVTYPLQIYQDTKKNGKSYQSTNLCLGIYVGDKITALRVLEKLVLGAASIFNFLLLYFLMWSPLVRRLLFNHPLQCNCTIVFNGDPGDATSRYPYKVSQINQLAYL